MNVSEAAAGEAVASHHQLLGLATLLRAAVEKQDLTPLGQTLIEYLQRHDDPFAWLDLSLLLELKQDKATSRVAQQEALQQRRHYPLSRGQTADALKLLVLKVPGDLQGNTPLECLLEGADMQIEAFYVDGQTPADLELPEHDLLFVAACARDENAPMLDRIEQIIAHNGSKVINRPAGIRLTTREAGYELLGKVPGICMAHTLRLSRERMLEVAAGSLRLPEIIEGDYPFIVRPVDSHGGAALEQVTEVADLARYLERTRVEEYYVAPFIDYRDADGLFRKYRIVMIGGKPYIGHMGVSSHWMVHYPYPEMLANPERGQEEARMMAEFDNDFARRHAQALSAIAERTGLEYVGFDCAETHDGRLLVFEIATAMVVHDMDDSQTFPYKLPQMRRVFDAFQAMLHHAAGSRPTPLKP